MDDLLLDLSRAARDGDPHARYRWRIALVRARQARRAGFELGDRVFFVCRQCKSGRHRGERLVEFVPPMRGVRTKIRELEGAELISEWVTRRELTLLEPVIPGGPAERYVLAVIELGKRFAEKHRAKNEALPVDSNASA